MKISALQNENIQVSLHYSTCHTFKYLKQHSANNVRNISIV